jgi:helicase
VSAALKEIYATPEISDLVRDVDHARLIAALRVHSDARARPDAAARLRIAAIAGLQDELSNVTIDRILRGDPAAPVCPDLTVFRTWEAYLDALSASQVTPSVDDMLAYAAAGYLARRDTEVRAFLRRIPISPSQGEKPWPEQVRDDVARALLFMARQGTRADLAASCSIVDRLSAIQQDRDSQWLASRNGSGRRDALTLLGLYHLAQVAVRLSEYMLSGSVADATGERRDLEPELKRLLTRAQDYLDLAADPEASAWLQSVAVVAWRLYSDSIWKTARGLYPRMNELLDSLMAAGREHPIFSLLPSQQEALRESLLDPVRASVVLQMPTSSGKTLLAEFAILQSLQSFGKDTRVLYLTPTRALATQVRRALNCDLRPLGIAVSAAGSAFEEDPYELGMLQSADGVIVATPEKADLLLRTHRDWFDQVRLIVVDEAHLLRDGERGVRLELLLANLRRECKDIRLLLLTPFVDNAAEIATWLGGDRGAPINIAWRPSRLTIGLAKLTGRKHSRAFEITWREPHSERPDPHPSSLSVNGNSCPLSTARDKLVHLARQFVNLGPVLGFFSASKSEPEKAAAEIAKGRDPLAPGKATPGLRLAIALAQADYGDDCILARCLMRGVAFHHAALSSELRFLIEDQVRAGTVDVLAATSTLAQGMNFPVSTVLVHSVHKPRGGGNLTPGEFWNIAGRAGRVGMADKGLVVFVNNKHRAEWEHYAEALSEGIRSALLEVLSLASNAVSLKEAYRLYPQLRPFFQYLAHAAASLGAGRARDALDELLQMSLANTQASGPMQSRQLRNLAQSYLAEIAGKQAGYLKTADSTGLGSFSFDSLYAAIRHDDLLQQGPGAVMASKAQGMERLIEALRWLPELDLGIGKGTGDMDTGAVARVVQAWIDGAPVQSVAKEFPGKELADRVRNAGVYVHAKVAMTVAWGAHAYLRGLGLTNRETLEASTPEQQMLPAYIQYGVRTPEAAVAGLLGVPRQLAEAVGEDYRDRHGKLGSKDANRLKDHVERADLADWGRILDRSALAGQVDPGDVLQVWRHMQGLTDS